MSHMNLWAVGMALAGLLAARPAWAEGPQQDTAPASDGAVQQDAVHQVFEEILQTLPSDVKAELDSVRARSHAVAADAPGSLPQAQDGAAARVPPDLDKALSDLPERVRRQVESTIRVIEKRNEQRELQFLELQQEKPKEEGDN